MRNILFVIFSFFTLSNALVIPARPTVPRHGQHVFHMEMAVGFSEEPSQPTKQELLVKVREELVQKYLEQGKSRSKAELEVDYFLSDERRSQEYLEMRKYAITQKDDGLGIDYFLALQFIGAFVIGYLGHAIADNGSSFW